MKSAFSLVQRSMLSWVWFPAHWENAGVMFIGILRELWGLLARYFPWRIDHHDSLSYTPHIHADRLHDHFITTSSLEVTTACSGGRTKKHSSSHQLVIAVNAISLLLIFIIAHSSHTFSLLSIPRLLSITLSTTKLKSRSTLKSNAGATESWGHGQASTSFCCIAQLHCT